MTRYRWISVILVLAMTAGLCSCGASREASDSVPVSVSSPDELPASSPEPERTALPLAEAASGFDLRTIVSGKNRADCDFTEKRSNASQRSVNSFQTEAFWMTGVKTPMMPSVTGCWQNWRPAVIPPHRLKNSPFPAGVFLVKKCRDAT